MELQGKRLLILGGTHQHCKLVRAARRMGVYAIVTDYLENSPAKKLADKAYKINVKDVDEIVDMCKKENVDGVIAGYIDPCQRPYNAVCTKLGVPCYGTKEQFFKMTDKHAFKRMCMENGVDVIPEYTEESIKNGTVEFPVFVKPVDSRGSRGQSVCHTMDELLKAVNLAKCESSNEDIIIEKYMRDAHEFQVTYFFIDGKPYIIRTVDSYCGIEEHHLEKVVACAISPSKYTQSYLDTVHANVVKMFKNLGITNGPVFMQGFEDHGKFRFFDPGLRFPGVDYEMIYQKVFGIDIMEAMVWIALTGRCPDFKLPENGVWLKGKRAAVLFPTVVAGKIGKIEGTDALEQDDSVVSFLPRCEVGETIGWTYNVNQRAAEIDILADDTDALRAKIAEIQKIFKVYNTAGENMTFELFDIAKIN